MTDHTRRTVLRGAALTAAAGVAGGAGGPAAATTRTVEPASRPRHHPFLEGAFKPVTEELTAFDLPVTGRVPRDLDGRFLRNGPNVLGLEDPRAHHWMLGDGMVHGARLREGSRRRTRAPRTTITRSPTSTIPSAGLPTWSCSPLRTSPASRSPGSICRAGSPSASTGAGSRTRE